MNTVRTALVFLSLAAACAADEVVLKNGSTFSGVVREDGDRVIVEMDFGTVTFRKRDVRSISRGEDLLSQFQEKSKGATTVKAMMELASWARDKGLVGRANELYRLVIVLDPDQPEARKALGYDKVNGQWLSGDELMVARGFIKLNGKWVTKETADRAAELEAQSRIESDRVDLARRVADQRHSEEMSRIALERERMAQDNCRDDRWWWRNGWAYAPGPFGGVAGYLLPASLPPPGTVPLTAPTVTPLGAPMPFGPSRR